MTSNQVAYGQAVENARHNAVNEVENERHNREMESLEDRKLVIEEMKANIQKDFNTESLRIQSSYNDLYLALQQAQGDRRLDIQQQLAEIEDEKKQVEADYKSRMAANAENLANLESLRVQELKRHDEKLEGISETTNKLKERELEYNKYQFNETIKTRRDELQQHKLEALESYWINSKKIAETEKQNRFERDKWWSGERDYIKAQTNRNAYGVFIDFLRGLSHLH